MSWDEAAWLTWVLGKVAPHIRGRGGRDPGRWGWPGSPAGGGAGPLCGWAAGGWDPAASVNI